MTRVVVLDSTPLGLLCGPPARPDVATARQWRDALVMAGHRLVIPEVIDYEVRRELLRANKTASVGRLTALRAQLEYLPLGTAAMERAAELWADARRRGLPTAPDPSLDIDVILAAQAESLAVPNTVIATSNVAHLVRFHPAEFWSSITP
jgi:predicted nucleic acid-binding protein